MEGVVCVCWIGDFHISNLLWLVDRTCHRRVLSLPRDIRSILGIHVWKSVPTGNQCAGTGKFRKAWYVKPRFTPKNHPNPITQGVILNKSQMARVAELDELSSPQSTEDSSWGEEKPKKLNANQKRALLARVLMENTYPTLSSLAAALGASERTARRHIEHLNSLGARIEKSETRRGRYVLRNPNWKPHFVSAAGRKMAHIENISQAIRDLIPADKRRLFRKEFSQLPRRDMVITAVSLMKALLKATRCPREQAHILNQAFKEASPKAWLKAYNMAQRRAIGQPAAPPVSMVMSYTSSVISMPASREIEYPSWIEQLNRLTPDELMSAIDSM